MSHGHDYTDAWIYFIARYVFMLSVVLLSISVAGIRPAARTMAEVQSITAKIINDAK